MYSRDEYRERLTNFYVRVGDLDNHNSASNSQCGGYRAAFTGASITIQCDWRAGRYVFIGVPYFTQALSLCEVEVMGHPAVRWTSERSVKDPQTLGGGAPVSSQAECYSLCRAAQATDSSIRACAYTCDGCFAGTWLTIQAEDAYCTRLGTPLGEYVALDAYEFEGRITLGDSFLSTTGMSYTGFSTGFVDPVSVAYAILGGRSMDPSGSADCIQPVTSADFLFVNSGQCKIGDEWGHTGVNYGAGVETADCLAAISQEVSCNQKMFINKNAADGGCYCFSDLTADDSSCDSFEETGWATFRITTGATSTGLYIVSLTQDSYFKMVQVKVTRSSAQAVSAKYVKPADLGSATCSVADMRVAWAVGTDQTLVTSNSDWGYGIESLVLGATSSERDDGGQYSHRCDATHQEMLGEDVVVTTYAGATTTEKDASCCHQCDLNADCAFWVRATDSDSCWLKKEYTQGNSGDDERDSKRRGGFRQDHGCVDLLASCADNKYKCVGGDADSAWWITRCPVTCNVCAWGESPYRCCMRKSTWTSVGRASSLSAARQLCAGSTHVALSCSNGESSEVRVRVRCLGAAMGRDRRCLI